MSNLSDFLVGKGYGLKEVLTASGTWSYSGADKPKKIFVRMIASAGGNANSGAGSNGGAGGNTVWDTGAVVATTTATGGGGATTSAAGTGTGKHYGGFRLTSPNSSPPSAGFGIYGITGAISAPSATMYTGASGEVKEFEYVPTADVAYTIGAGGTEGTAGYGVGQQGVIEIYY